MENLSADTKRILKETEHLIWDYQFDITHRMYEIMFQKYPQTKNLFKSFRKEQPNVFGSALMSHLISIDNPEALHSFRIEICRKHVEAGVKEEHYAMMAESLDEAMREVLSKLATEEMIEAWGKWFYFISNLLIERERDHYSGERLLFPQN